MPFFVVTMSHPEGEAWGRHLQAHMEHLKLLVADGRLRASGRLKGKPLRSGFLIFSVGSRGELDRLIEKDPFAKENLIAELTVNEWDPFLGVFSGESSGDIPELGAPL